MNFDFSNMFQKKSRTPLAYESPSVSTTEGRGDPETEAISSEKILELYRTNSWVRKYINALVNGCLRYPLTAVPKRGFEKDSTAINQCIEVNKMLTNANEYEVFSEVREKYLRDFFLYGTGCLEISPKGQKSATQLYAAPGYLLRAKYDDNGNLDRTQAWGFLDTETQAIAKETVCGIQDIVAFKLDQLSDRFYGTSPMVAVNSEITADVRAVKEMGRGDFGIPVQVISAPKQTKTFIDQLVMKIQAVLTGRGGNKVIAANASERMEQIKLSNKEFKDDFELQKWLVQRTNVFGIPPFKLGFVSEVGGMSAREQREEFLEQIATYVTFECQKLTYVLCMLKMKYENIEIISPELITRLDVEKSKVVERLVAAGILTPNEARERYLSLPRSPDKEADKLKG